MEKRTIQTSVGNLSVKIRACVKEGKLPPILFLHGFGSSKEDYYDFYLRSENQDRGFYAFDLPGLGESTVDKPENVSIEWLVDLTCKLVDFWGINSFHISGHSMGGLTSLLVADRLKDRVLSFTNIEGNLAPEDTFMSGQIIKCPAKSPEEFFRQFIARTEKVKQFGYPLYLIGAKYKIDPKVVPSYFKSIYNLSHQQPLLEYFINLPAEKMFIHGIENSGLPYLPKLKKSGVTVSSVPYASHFPMYSNPVFLFDQISGFIRSTEQ